MTRGSFLLLKRCKMPVSSRQSITPKRKDKQQQDGNVKLATYTLFINVSNLQCCHIAHLAFLGHDFHTHCCCSRASDLWTSWVCESSQSTHSRIKKRKEQLKNIQIRRRQVVEEEVKKELARYPFSSSCVQQYNAFFANRLESCCYFLALLLLASYACQLCYLLLTVACVCSFVQ